MQTEDPTPHEIRRVLSERAEQLRVELLELEQALKGLDDAMAAAKKLLAAKNKAAVASASPVRTKSGRRRSKKGSKPNVTEGVLTLAFEKEATFNPRDLAIEANEKGLKVSQKQVSTVLRRAREDGAFQLIRAGGPRQPAIYANIGYEAEQSESYVSDMPIPARYKTPKPRPEGGGHADKEVA